MAATASRQRPEGTAAARSGRRTGTVPVLAALVGALVLAACGAASTSGTGRVNGGTAPVHPPWTGAFTGVAVPPSVGTLTAVTCPTDRRCWAVGSTTGTATLPAGAAVLASADGGSTWTSQSPPPGTLHLAALACPTAVRCVAAGQSGTADAPGGTVIVTADAGTTWTAGTLPPGVVDVTALACPSVHRCVAVASGAGGVVSLTSGDGGSTWTVAAPVPGLAAATGMACTDATTCWVVGEVAQGVGHVLGGVAVTSDGAGSWTGLPLPVGTGPLDDIACRTGGAAVRAPSTTPTSSPAQVGATTTTSPSPPPVPAADCTAVGTSATQVGAVRAGTAVVLTTRDGGSSWAAAARVAPAAALLGVSCLPGGDCVAVGNANAYAGTAGVALLTGTARNPWNDPAPEPAAQGLTDVACRSLAHCVAVGQASILRLGAG